MKTLTQKVYNIITYIKWLNLLKNENLLKIFNKILHVALK